MTRVLIFTAGLLLGAVTAWAVASLLSELDQIRLGEDPSLAEIRAELSGHDLACWCPLVDADSSRVPCHADVLLEVANSEASE